MTPTPGCRCNRLEALRFAAILLLLLQSIRPAAAQNPIPLPHDPSLAACVSVSDNFRSANTGEERHLLMRWEEALKQKGRFKFPDLLEMAQLTDP